MSRVYLDYNATTPVEPQVLDSMLPYFSADFANASSIHSPGQRARAAVETAREQVAALIGAKAQEIVLTSGGTESDNHAIFGVLAAKVAQPFLAVRPSAHQPEPPHIITAAIEHEAVLNACQALETQGAAVTYLPVNREGLVDSESVRRAIRPETIVITIMHANNELGTVQPLEEIGRIAKEHKIYFHTDAVQSAGKSPIDVNALNVDLLSLGPQALRPQRRRRSLHPHRHSPPPVSLWRPSSARSAPRHGKRRRNCRPRKSRRNRAHFSSRRQRTHLHTPG